MKTVASHCCSCGHLDKNKCLCLLYNIHVTLRVVQLVPPLQWCKDHEVNKQKCIEDRITSRSW